MATPEQTLVQPDPSAAHAAMPLTASQSIGVGLASLLRERIATGFYRPGEWIRERSLFEEFGYSNGPIREALQILVSEQLLVREAWRGVRVVQLSSKEIVEIFQLRMTLLELAVELMVKHATEEQIQKGKNLLKDLDVALAKADPNARSTTGNQFSRWLCECSGNSRLSQSWSQISWQTRMYVQASLNASNDPARLSEPLHEMLEAIERRDSSAAKSAVRFLCRRTLEGLGLELGL